GADELAHFASHTELLFGADYGPLVVRDHQWWRLVTSMFVHSGPAHLLMNMVALYQAGPLLEQHYGRLRFLLLYLAAGLAGALASLAWNWHDPVVSVGASGAGCGLVAAGAVAGQLRLGQRYRDSMLRWLALIAAFGLFVGNIDNAAHFGGMAAGACIAWLLD